MAKTKEHKGHDYDSFPWKHLIGFILSLVLTVAAVYVALEMDLTYTVIMWTISIFAIIQAVLQLFMFMHMTESEDGIWQAGTILYAAFIAIVVVIGSVWVMYFGIHRHDPIDVSAPTTEEVSVVATEQE